MSNPLSSLPPEIFHEILIAAVMARGIRRATRLRYVSRTWDTAVMDAIFASRILNNGVGSGFYWGRYVAFRTMSRLAGLALKDTVVDFVWIMQPLTVTR